MNVPLSNTLIMQASWNAGREDEWVFESAIKNQNLVLLKDANMSRTSKNQYKSNRLVFELVMTIMINNKKFNMSCGCGKIDLTELNQTQDRDIELHGGNLQTEVEIGSMDSNTRNLKNRMISVIKIKNRIIDKASRSGIKLSEKCTYLPKTILVPRNSLHLVKTYRMYCGIKSEKRGVLYRSLEKEIPVRTMQKIYNLWSVHKSFANFWNGLVRPRVKALKDNYKDVVDIFERVMMKMFVMFESEEFGYMVNMPTTECFDDKKLDLGRRNLMKRYFEEIELELKGKGGSMNTQGFSGISRPFSIDDLIEDEFEYLEMLKEDIVVLGEF